jgi:hypothetical protein
MDIVCFLKYFFGLPDSPRKNFILLFFTGYPAVAGPDPL